MKKIYLLLLLLLSVQLYAVQKRKVLIITVSGVRPDALQKANTPAIDWVISKGFFTYEAWNRGYTYNIPAWVTMMTGVEYNKHAVMDNSFTGNNLANYPFFINRAKSVIPNLFCAQILDMSTNQAVNDGWDVTLTVPYCTGSSSVSEAQNQLANPNLDVLSVVFDSIDVVGHTGGFSMDNPDYISAIETTDHYIDSILTALHNRPTYADEDWTILLSTDYGGIGKSHGGNSNEERQIWWMGMGNAGISRQLKDVTDPGSIVLNNYNPAIGSKSPGHHDIAVTALDHLLRGVSYPTINPSWNLDGKSWLDSMHTPEIFTNISSFTGKKANVQIYPNPTTGIVSLWFENDNNENVSFRVIDILGKVINESVNETVRKNKLNIDMSNNIKGIYFVELVIGNEKITQKIILNE